MACILYYHIFYKPYLLQLYKYSYGCDRCIWLAEILLLFGGYSISSELIMDVIKIIGLVKEKRLGFKLHLRAEIVVDWKNGNMDWLNGMFRRLTWFWKGSEFYITADTAEWCSGIARRSSSCCDAGTVFGVRFHIGRFFSNGTIDWILIYKPDVSTAEVI